MQSESSRPSSRVTLEGRQGVGIEPSNAVSEDTQRLLARRWVERARGVLHVLGSGMLLFGLFFPLIYGGTALADPTLDPVGVELLLVFGLMGLMCTWSLAAPLFLVARGLGQGARWAWLSCMLIGVFCIPSIGMPIGVFLLYAMLQEPVREAFRG